MRRQLGLPPNQAIEIDIGTNPAEFANVMAQTTERRGRGAEMKYGQRGIPQPAPAQIQEREIREDRPQVDLGDPLEHTGRRGHRPLVQLLGAQRNEIGRRPMRGITDNSNQLRTISHIPPRPRGRLFNDEGTSEEDRSVDNNSLERIGMVKTLRGRRSGRLSNTR